MKASVWTAMFLSLGALWACSCGSGSGGTSMFTSSSTSGSGSGSGGSGGGSFTTSNAASSSSGGADCSLMPDHQSCIACEAAKHPMGSMLYDALNNCLYCSECYNVCDGKAKGCAAPPIMKGMCDGNAPDPMACGDTNGGCVKCAYAGACQSATNACVGNQDCVDYGSEVTGCKP